MKYVLDACIGIKWVLPEENSDKALILRDDFKNKLVDLIAPDSFPPEVTHALTRAERKGLVTPEEGARGFILLMDALPEIHPTISLLPRAYELSSQVRLGVFDCLYVALAEREQCQCVTADKRMLTLFPGTTISLEDVPA